MTFSNQFFGLLFHIFFLCWGLKSDIFQIGQRRKWLLPACSLLLTSDPSGLCSSFFSGHYIPSGLISLISHWLRCQNSFLHYCSLLKGGRCWILRHIPFDLPWILFFYNIYFFFLPLFIPVAEKRGLIISMKPALLFVSKY